MKQIFRKEIDGLEIYLTLLSKCPREGWINLYNYCESLSFITRPLTPNFYSLINLKIPNVAFWSTPLPSAPFPPVFSSSSVKRKLFSQLLRPEPWCHPWLLSLSPRNHPLSKSVSSVFSIHCFSKPHHCSGLSILSTPLPSLIPAHFSGNSHLDSLQH